MPLGSLYEPNILAAGRRKLMAPLKLRMDRLHRMLQVAAGWTDSHLCEFRYQETEWGVPIMTLTATFAMP